jgi:hypothetical protein
LFRIAEGLPDNAATRKCAVGYEAAGFERVVPKPNGSSVTQWADAVFTNNRSSFYEPAFQA